MGFIPLKFIDVIDIILVASLFYSLYRGLKGTNAPYILVGIFVIYLVWILVNTFSLVLFSAILGQIISVGVIAILIIFQPEIRDLLDTIGSGSIKGIKTFSDQARKKQAKAKLY